MKFTGVIRKEGKWYVAWCPELDIASQGRTIEEAIKNLKEAIELYLEDEDAVMPTTSEIALVEVEIDAKTPSSISA